jgi:DNA polymerase-3 subunit delta'
MIYKDTGNDSIVINKDKIKEIIEAASLFSYNKLNSIIDIINNARENFNSNANTALTYDVMLLKMLEA